MARREYDPAIASRINKDDYNYLFDLAERRGEYLSDILRVAIIEYVEKCKRIDMKRKDNA